MTRNREPSAGQNRIHILESDGLKIAHMGDIGCPLIRDKRIC